MPHSQLYAGGADSVDADIMDKGGSLQSKENSQVQALHAATIDIHLVFHHILSGKYLWLRLGVFFLHFQNKCDIMQSRSFHSSKKALAGKTAWAFLFLARF